MIQLMFIYVDDQLIGLFAKICAGDLSPMAAAENRQSLVACC